MGLGKARRAHAVKHKKSSSKLLTYASITRRTVYFLQQQAPKPKRIVCQNETPNKPPFYGREYHGAISREDADFLLTIQGEGSYLIRESLRAPGQYTLAIRFEGVTKNFKLYYDGQHYVGEKRFDTINDLVADGLITFYLESKASDYIATLSSRSNYAESPYVAYNTHKKQQLNLAQQPLSGAKHHAAANKAAAHGAGNSSSGVAAQNDDDGFYEQPQATPVASNHSAASSSGGAASGSSSGSGRSGNRSDSGGRSAASGAARSKKSSAASSSKISNGSAVGGAGSAAAMPASSVGAVVGASIVTSQDVYDTPASNSSVHHAVGVNVGVGVGMGVGGVQQQRDRRRQKRESAPPSVHSTPAHQSDSGDSGSPSSNHHHRHNQQPQLPLQPTPKHKQSANNNKDSLQTSSQAVAAQRNAHEQVSRRRSGPRDSQPHHHDPTQPHQGRSSSGSGVSGRTSSSSSSSATPPAVPPHAVPPNAVSTSAHTTPVHVGAIAAGSGAAPPQSPSAGSALSSSPVGASTGAGPIHRTPHTPQMGSRSKVNLPVEGRLSQILETRKQHDAQHHQQHAAAPAAAAVTAAGTSSVTTTTTTTTATTATTANNVATSNSNGSGTGSSGGGGDSSSVNGRINHSTNTDGPSSTTSSATRWRPCSVQEYDKAHRFNKMFDDNPQFSTPPSSPPNSLPPSAGAGMHSPSSGAILGSPGGLVINTGGMAGLGSPPSSADQAKASSVSWCANYLSVQGCAKPHNFKLYTFKGPHWCDFCANFLWGLIAQGVKCQDCGFNAHKKCSEKVPNDCMPDMRYVKRMFGVDLTTLVKAQNTLIPVVVEMCIKEIENRGIRAEGLYRVAGFHDDVEAIKMSFDKDGELTDISEERYEDLNTITSLLKLYFRLLPIPLITFDIYYKVIELVKQEPLTSEERLMMLQQTLKLLQPAHYHTLKYLIGHLHRVQELQQYNMMSAENLSIVFAPTLLRSPESDDPLTSLSAVKYERELVELMVIHYQQLFE